jgi:hypothetical protein
MNDPHVEVLRYSLLVVRDGIDFDDARPLSGTRDGLTFELDQDQLVIRPTGHYASEEAARAVVDPLVRAWEIKHALTFGPEIRFEFASSAIIDRNPAPAIPPGSPRAVSGKATMTATVAISGSASVSRGSYPTPPDGFVVDPDVETLYQRWQGYLERREPLQSMAYFCLTVLEMHGGRDGAAGRFAITKPVLNKLGELTSKTGDAATARKAGATSRPLTDLEQAWLEAAVKLTIRRAGEVAAQPGATLPAITMADLPGL